REYVVSKGVARAHHRSGLGQEQIMQMLGENGRASARRLDEGVAEPAGYRGRRDGEQAGERAENQIDAIRRDQILVVADNLGRVRRVIDDLQTDLASEQATLCVDRIGP